MQPILSVRNLTKIFGTGCPLCAGNTGPAPETNKCAACGTINACSGINFDLYPEEILGIVGESGSGKTTVLRLLHFDWDPTEGEVILNTQPEGRRKTGEERQKGLAGLDGTNLLAMSAYQKRLVRNNYMGIVFQNPHIGLRLNISAGGNIAERLLNAGWRSVSEIRERGGNLLERTEVPRDRMDELPVNFSGGMQQRVQIAKALSNGPSVLFLDEPTTGLDVSVQARVLDLIRKLQQEFHIATLVVSHDLGVIRMLTKRTIVMKNGRIVETGLTDQILEDPQHPYSQLMVSSVL